jgi:hypothetical protein
VRVTGAAPGRERAPRARLRARRAGQRPLRARARVVPVQPSGGAHPAILARPEGRAGRAGMRQRDAVGGRTSVLLASAAPPPRSDRRRCESQAPATSSRPAARPILWQAGAGFSTRT